LLNFIGFISLNISGKGIYGIVFLCRHKLNGQMYAVKIVKFNKHHDQDKVLREVKALAKCNHNNMVGYFTAWIELRVVWSSDEDEGYDEEVGCDGATLKDPDAMLFIQIEHCHQ
jgi:serine/threonine protein kinase